jgi:hypothetical protein
MGLPVLAEHDSTGYTLSVNHPEVEGVLSFRTQAVAQAVMNFLLEFSPYAYVPMPEGPTATQVAQAAIAELERRLSPAVEALMDAASPPDPSEVLNNGKAHEGAE